VTVVCCLGVLLAGAVVVVHLVTVWLAVHAWAVWVVAGSAAAGGGLGGWVAVRREDRRRRGG
jgi:hypothetical protein